MISLSEAVKLASQFSLFVRQTMERYPDLLSDIDLSFLSVAALEDQVRLKLMTLNDEDTFRHLLRYIRRHQMVRIAVRDLSGIASLDETLAETSALADVLIRVTYDWLYARLSAKWGVPVGVESGAQQQMIILGMGKLGGHELNYSSDIDLIFVFPEKGETIGTDQGLSNEEFFTKLGQQLNQFLNNITADGMVFRVDMRLRPFGSAGALVHSFDAFEQYYQVHGRPWERYAMVKARAITGKVDDIMALEAMMRPFIYRRYVDFTMLSSMRDLKRMIALEVMKKGADRDIKLGAGGIREIEFIAQAFQLVYGGRDMLLQGRELMPVYARLAKRHYLDVAIVEGLLGAYRFLRQVENRLQMWADQQTHLLPVETERLHLLAESMGFVNSHDFMHCLDGHRSLVQAQFAAVLGDGLDEPDEQWRLCWLDPMAAHWSDTVDDVSAWQHALLDFKESKSVILASSETELRLDNLLPLLLSEMVHQGAPVEALQRVLLVIKSILKRSAYLVLLQESKQSRRLLVKLCIASAWLADYLAKMPALLDQLLDERQLFSPMSKAALVEELQQQLLDVGQDEERLMDAIRHFKHAQVFRVAASDMTGVLPLMRVSDYLTWIAEAIVDVALEKAWRLVIAKHGVPVDWRPEQGIPFLVVGFGKLGGLELGYGSDLDVVYLSDDQLDAQAMTTGGRSLEYSLLVIRLGQKLTSLLSTQTVAGVAYEVDMQLRPHGASGSLVVSLAAFFKYEREQAWVWEHQALIRTRAIAGSSAMQMRFEQERVAFLRQSRDANSLRQSVLSMRDKMRQHLDKSKQGWFDIKQGRGGIIDIEFMVQYWVLLSAEKSEEIVCYSDNIRQLAALAKYGVIRIEVAESLMSDYQFYRHLAHQQAIGSLAGGVVAEEKVVFAANRVMDIWQSVFEA